METDEVGKLQKEIRSLKKQVERLEASRATFELMVDRNDNLLSRQLEPTDTPRAPGTVTTRTFGPRMCARATKRPPRSRWRTSLPSSLARSRCMT